MTLLRSHTSPLDQCLIDRQSHQNCMGRRRFASPKVGALSRENCIHDTMICFLPSSLSSSSWGLSIGEHAKTQVKPVSLPSKCSLMKKVASRAVSWLPLFRPHPSLVLRAALKPLSCSNDALLRSSGAGGTCWVLGSGLSLTSSATPDRPFNLFETYFPYLHVTQLLCALT